MARLEASLEKALATLIPKIEARLRKCESEAELQRAHEEGISRIGTRYRQWLSSQRRLSPRDEQMAQKIAALHDMRIRKVQRQKKKELREEKYRRAKERAGDGKA